MSFTITYRCQECGHEIENAPSFDCPKCLTEGALRGLAPDAIIKSNIYWDKPKRIHALRPDHPDHFAYSPDDAKRKLARNDLMTRPDDNSGVTSPLGTLSESPRAFSGKQVGKDPGVNAVRTKIRKIRPKRR